MLYFYEHESVMREIYESFLCHDPDFEDVNITLEFSDTADNAVSVLKGTDSDEGTYKIIIGTKEDSVKILTLFIEAMCYIFNDASDSCVADQSLKEWIQGFTEISDFYPNIAKILFDKYSKMEVFNEQKGGINDTSGT